MVIKGKIRIFKWEDKQKVSFFFLTKAKETRRREKSKERKRRKKRTRRKKSKKKEKEKKAKPRYVFVLNSWVFWIPKDLVWRIVVPLYRVLWKEHPNP